MNDISASTSAPRHHATSRTISAAAAVLKTDDKSQADARFSTNDEDATTVSILARQLSDAAMQADTRPGHKSHQLESITGSTYFANKAQHDAEIPNTSNLELLARARQATGFVNGSDVNPFQRLATEQLNLIAHNEGGPFTINERRAAWEALQTIASPAVSSTQPLPNNGREIMISRLFGGREPPVAQPPATLYNIAQKSSDFLNLDDRSLISDMYAYAQAEGAALEYVDRLIKSLSTYRNYSDGRQLGNGNIGHYDPDGYKVSYEFKPEDRAIASRILNSAAINSTRIDQGFLRYVLDPGHGAFMNVGGLPFLERMVSKLSSEGADQPRLGSEFAAFDNAVFEDHIVRTTHKDTRLPPSKALSGVTNGVWALTELGKAQGYRLDKRTGVLSKSDNAVDEQTSQVSVPKYSKRTLLDILQGGRDQPPIRYMGPGNLFKFLRSVR